MFLCGKNIISCFFLFFISLKNRGDLTFKKSSFNLFRSVTYAEHVILKLTSGRTDTVSLVLSSRYLHTDGILWMPGRVHFN
jgi:hypothetical protein